MPYRTRGHDRATDERRAAQERKRSCRAWPSTGRAQKDIAPVLTAILAQEHFGLDEHILGPRQLTGPKPFPTPQPADRACRGGDLHALRALVAALPSGRRLPSGHSATRKQTAPGAPRTEPRSRERQKTSTSARTVLYVQPFILDRLAARARVVLRKPARHNPNTAQALS